MRRIWLALLLASLPALVGCTGAGLGEGAGPPDLGPMPPPNLNDPVYNGELSGSILFDPGFLENELLATSTHLSTGSGLGADRAYLKSLRVKVWGLKQHTETRVDEDGAFHLGKLRHGDYTLGLFQKGKQLAQVPVSLDGKSTMVMTLRIMGYDLANLTGQDDPWAFYIEKEAQYSSQEVEYRRVYPPGGDVRTFLPDGSVETLGADGIVKSVSADGRVTYRLDPQNRFYDEDLDPDTGRKKQPRAGTGGDKLLARLEGKGRAPLITQVQVSPTIAASRSELTLGDLAALSVKTDANGGSPVRQVNALVYTSVGSEGVSHVIRPRRLALADDGGRVDLDPATPGLQSSLDQTASDGTFTGVLALDPRHYSEYRACQIVVTATNERGLTSRPSSLHLYLPRARARGTIPMRISRAVMTRLASGEIEARLELASPLEGITATWLGPSGFHRVLAQRSATLLVTTAPSLSGTGLYTIVASGPACDVAWASFPIGPRDLAARPTASEASDGDADPDSE